MNLTPNEGSTIGRPSDDIWNYQGSRDKFQVTGNSMHNLPLSRFLYLAILYYLILKAG